MEKRRLYRKFDLEPQKARKLLKFASSLISSNKQVETGKTIALIELKFHDDVNELRQRIENVNKQNSSHAFCIAA